jgi:hypothetical protein
MATLILMARPKKNDRDRKDIDLRIPVTQDQKRLIVEAANLDGLDMAGWARQLLLRAAKLRHEKEARSAT